MLGRFDDLIVTGGLKADLAAVELQVRAWAGARGGDGVVVAVPDPEWGSRIVAVCEGEGSLEAMRTALRRRLPPHTLPRELVLLPSLPRLAGGKPDRPAIRTLLLNRAELRP